MTALDTLVENHRAFLRFLERRVGSREAAEDLLQEAFGRALEHAPALGDKESVVAWFYRVLRNVVVDHYRRRGVAQRGKEAFSRELEATVPGREVHREICACVGRLAAGLKPEYAEALRRVEIDGATVKAYAAERDLTPGTAAVRLFRARQALRKQVVASCGTCAEHGCLDCGCRAKPSSEPESSPGRPGEV
jgi:RNA polymerase sigma-70 factor (ECF subfamily)